eukprot:1138382-Pelagomonas_calceolata.AAC.7
MQGTQFHTWHMIYEQRAIRQLMRAVVADSQARMDQYAPQAHKIGVLACLPSVTLNPIKQDLLCLGLVLVLLKVVPLDTLPLTIEAIRCRIMLCLPMGHDLLSSRAPIHNDCI